MSAHPISTHTFRRLWFDYILERLPVYLLGASMVLATNLSQVLAPRITGWAIDFIKGLPVPAWFYGASRTDTFFNLFWAFVGIQITLMLGRMGWRYFLARQSHLASSWLREKVWSHARYFSNDTLNRKFTLGSLMNASTSDVNQGRFIYGFTLVGITDSVCLTVLAIAMMISIDWQMAMLVLVIFPLIPVIQWITKREAERYDEAQEFLSEFNDQCTQSVATIKLQRLTQTGKFWEKKLFEAAKQYREKRLRSLYTGFLFFPAMGGGAVLGMAALFLFGISRVIEGQMTIGEFVAMQSYVIIIQDPLLDLGFIISEFQRGKTSVNRLGEIYNQDPDPTIHRSGQIVEKQSKPVFQVFNLNFSYPDQPRQKVLNDIRLELHTGDRLGILGPIGSGKSTLIRILSGLEQRYSGSVLFYGREVSQYTHLSLRSYIGIVPQKPFLFADSIRQNIRMNHDLSDEEVWETLRIAGLDEDIRQFPDQLGTQLGEWGINLSGGQKQRLTLARTLAQDPELLILDDCLSAVDTVTEEKILARLDERLRGKTVIWVAHRKSTLKYCNQILELGHE